MDWSILVGMIKLDDLKRHLKPGQAYRRADLARWSTSVDRHAGGLYVYPKETAFGPALSA